MSIVQWLFTSTNTAQKEPSKTTDIESLKRYYLSKYNWILSYPLKKYPYMDDNILNKFITVNVDEEGHEIINGKKYIDLRPDCPNILDDRDLNLSPISTICFILHYQLIRNKLDIFPPSRLFLYHNTVFFKDSKQLFTFDSIFKTIETCGFCSELIYTYNRDNMKVNKLSHIHYEDAEQYKFIHIYRIPNSIAMIKKMLQNNMIIAIGFVLYNNIHINSKITIADTNTNTIIGGTMGAIVGYIEKQQSFIIALSYGKDMGKDGYILLPFKYVSDKDLLPELYYIDFDVTQIQNFISNKKKMLDTMKKGPHKNHQPYGGLFS
jgi:hypothetical protein